MKQRMKEVLTYGRMVLECSLAIVLLAIAGCERVARDRAEWMTMGTVAAVQSRSVDGKKMGAEVSLAVSNAFAEVERLLNAHNPTSEIRRLAALPDAEILEKCDPLVRPCYEAAFRFREESGGVFDPRWRGPGTMDLGGIAKGFALDIARERIARDASDDLLLDLGGNLAAVKGAWNVGVFGGDALTLEAGFACATSAEYFRGKHIFDPRTGNAVSNDVESVTVIAPSATDADALSTILFILGREAGDRYLRAHHPACRAIWLMK